MKPINIDEVKSGFRGKPYNTLIQYHIKRQNTKQLAIGIEGTKGMLPKEVLSPDMLNRFDEFFDRWNSKAYEQSFWEEDCADVFTEIINDASKLLIQTKIKHDDEALFNIFQIVTLNFALAASEQPKFRKFAGIKKGLFS